VSVELFMTGGTMSMNVTVIRAGLQINWFHHHACSYTTGQRKLATQT